MIYSGCGTVTVENGADVVSVPRHHAGCALFGPYEAYPPGNYSVEFKAHIPPGARRSIGDSQICCIVDVASDVGSVVHARRQIPASILKRDGAALVLEFQLQEIKHLEFRCFSTGAAPLIVCCERKVVSRDDKRGRFRPILEDDDAPHDQLFVDCFNKFLDLHAKGAAITPTRTGTIINFQDVSFVVRHVEDFQLIWEIFEMNFYNFNTKSDTCVLDIGMNVGLASLYFARMPCVKRVHGFEPFAPPLARATENFALNPELTSKIQAHHYGLGAETRQYSVRYDAKSTIGQSVRGSETGEKTTISLRSASETLREILPEAKSRGWQIVVKMDCEGSEFAIIETLDADGLLPEIRILMIEWHKWWSPEKTQKELTARLLKNGFDVLDHTNPFSPLVGDLYAIRTSG